MTRFGVVLALAALGACAQQDNVVSTCNSKSVNCLASAGGESGGASGMTGTAAGASGMTMSGAGTTAAGAAPVAGADSGGAPTAGAAGAAMGGGGSSGAPAGGAPAGGSSGTAGKGGGAGTAGTGGTAGTAGTSGSVGTAGVGGGQSALCLTPVPARTGWTATTNTQGNQTDLAANAIDTSLTSRYATGTKMLGMEWLQIDFGAGKATIDQVAILTSNDDYGRHLQIRMSNTSADTAAPVVAEADGMTGTQTFYFVPKTARYLLISQTGMLTTGATWWSVHDLNAYCN